MSLCLKMQKLLFLFSLYFSLYLRTFWTSFRNELYDLKHELIATQIKLDNTAKSLKEANETLNENSKQIIRLETELKGSQNT